MSDGKKAAALVLALVLVFGLVIAIVLANPGLYRPPEDSTGIAVGQFAPDFTIGDVNGTEWSLSGHRGRVVLIDFMGTNCAACIQEMQAESMQTVFYTHAQHGFTIISIDVGSGFGGLGTEDPEAAWRFLKGIPPEGGGWSPGGWTIALDNQALVSTFQVVGLPLKYLVDETGRILWKHTGFVTASDLDAQVTFALG